MGKGKGGEGDDFQKTAQDSADSLMYFHPSKLAPGESFGEESNTSSSDEPLQHEAAAGLCNEQDSLHMKRSLQMKKRAGVDAFSNTKAGQQHKR